MSKVRKLQPKRTPQPVQTGASVQNPELFEEGYQHGLVSNVLTDFRSSFRAGFRKAKIEQREERKRQGIHSFPYQKFTIR